MLRLLIVLVGMLNLQPYWAVASIQFVPGDNGGVQAYCTKCYKPVGPESESITLKEAKRLARKHKHRK